MKTLTITLKQHTPLIHFQHSEPGAKLRATEVKPKLDRYILTKLGGGNYETGINRAKEQGLLTGKGEHPALDYKLRISASGKDKILRVMLAVSGVLRKVGIDLRRKLFKSVHTYHPLVLWLFDLLTLG